VTVFLALLVQFITPSLEYVKFLTQLRVNSALIKLAYLPSIPVLRTQLVNAFATSMPT